MQGVQSTVDPEEYVSELAESGAPDPVPEYCLQFITLHERKLWKQLTDLLLRFYDEPASKPYRLPIYNNFIAPFAKRTSQLKRVRLATAAAAESETPRAAIEFVQKILPDVDHPKARDAYVLCLIDIARLQLVLGEADAAKVSAAQAGKQLEEFDSVDPIIHAAYYRVLSDYHKAKAEYSAYYRNALLYLACVNLDDLGEDERQMRAHDLSLSALLAEKIYNFGELLLHPILDALDGTQHAWLKDFVVALNSGDLLKFESLLRHLPSQPLLDAQLGFLRQKVCLMALIESVFKRPPHDRVLSFAAVSHETRLPAYEVEHLVMKALSLDLVRGTIDQVDETVTVSWVQPRVLDMKQIENMRHRLVDWAQDVKKVESLMHAQAQSFIAV